MKNNSLYLISLSVLLFSCSEGGGGGGSTPPGKHTDNLELEMNGIYQAKLKPINSRFSDHLGGSLTLVRDKDDFIADVRLSGGPKTTLHSQSIHIGERCPDASDDLNLDGFIDGMEGANVYSDMLIPLDDDLSSQWMGLGIYPVTDDYGFYFWSRTVSFDKMMADLRSEDINTTDEIAKIASNKTFQASGKVIIIRGIPQTEILPDTVAGRGRQSPQEALPIACGMITKITSAPGVIDRDQTGIPVPADGNTLGGSGGADDGAIFTPGTSTGDTGNYGDDHHDDVEVRGNNTEYGTTGGVPN